MGQEALLLALACGSTVENAARKAGISTRTAFRRLADPAFQEQISNLRTDMVQRATGMLTLVSLQDPAVAAPARLGAARAVIEHGIKLREESDLATRLAALEEQMECQAKQG